MSNSAKFNTNYSRKVFCPVTFNLSDSIQVYGLVKNQSFLE